MAPGLRRISSPLSTVKNPHADDQAEANGSAAEMFDDDWEGASHENWQEPPLAKDIEEIHEAACEEGRSMYKDPSTGKTFMCNSIYDQKSALIAPCNLCGSILSARLVPWALPKLGLCFYRKNVLLCALCSCHVVVQCCLHVRSFTHLTLQGSWYLR